MSTAFKTASLITNSSNVISMSQQLSFSASAPNPGCLVINAYNRNEYAAASSGTTGSFGGGGHTLGVSAIGGDACGTKIVFALTGSSRR